MLTRIRNANLVKSPKVFVLQTDLTISISKILKEEGYISSFEKDFQIKNGSYLCIDLKFKGLNQRPYITVLKRVSKPGLRIYSKVSQIPKVSGGIGTAVFCHEVIIK